MKSSGDPYWFQDISVLFHKERLLEFIPTKNMTTSERFNTIVRLTIYISVIYILVKDDLSIILLPLSIMGLTYLFSKRNYDPLEKFMNNNSCKLPTRKNPMMNHLPFKKNKKDGCSVLDDKISKKIDEELEKGFAQDSNTFGEHDLAGQRFHPVQNNIGDTYNDFKIWCYSGPAVTCKEDSSVCPLPELGTTGGKSNGSGASGYESNLKVNL